MVRRHVVPALCSFLALTVPLAACGKESTNDQSSSSGGGDSLVVYSGRNEKLIGPLLTKFTEQTGIKVEAKYGDSAELALTIDREGDRTPAEVVLSQSPGATGLLADRGRLATLPATATEAVPASARSSKGDWVGITARVRILVVNTTKVPEAERPKSVFDLTSPAWKGRIGVAPTNGSFQDFVSSIRDAEGDAKADEWLKGLAANEARTFGDNNAIVEAVGRGEVDAGLVNHYYVAKALAERPDLPIAPYFFSNDAGSVALYSTAAITKGAANDASAQRLVEFLVGAEAAEYFVNETAEYSVRPGTPSPTNVPTLESLSLKPVDLEGLGRLLPTTLEHIKASGLTR